jgi:hypothetical protein
MDDPQQVLVIACCRLFEEFPNLGFGNVMLAHRALDTPKDCEGVAITTTQKYTNMGITGGMSLAHGSVSKKKIGTGLLTGEFSDSKSPCLCDLESLRQLITL